MVFFCKIPVGICSFFLLGWETGGEFDYHSNYVMYLVIKWWVSELIQQLIHALLDYNFFYSKIPYSLVSNSQTLLFLFRKTWLPLSCWTSFTALLHGWDILGVSGIPLELELGARNERIMELNAKHLKKNMWQIDEPHPLTKHSRRGDG